MTALSVLFVDANSGETALLQVIFVLFAILCAFRFITAEIAEQSTTDRLFVFVVGALLGVVSITNYSLLLYHGKSHFVITVCTAIILFVFLVSSFRSVRFKLAVWDARLSQAIVATAVFIVAFLANIPLKSDVSNFF